MKLAHCSDTHGYLWPEIPDDCDVVIHSGDGLPNRSRGRRSTETPFQTEWVTKNVEKYREWLKGKPLIYVPGNHCFISPCEILAKAGIEAIDISNKLYEFDGKKLWGFPFIPYIAGEWAYECTVDMMQREIRKLKDILLSEKVDILVAHAPLYGILDNNATVRDENGNLTNYGDHCGNRQMINMFMYDVPEERWPQLYCHGHLHESWGTDVLTGEGRVMVISNAATTLHTIHIS